MDLDQSFVDKCADIPRVLGSNVVGMDGAPVTDAAAQSPLPSSMLTPEALEMVFGMLFDMIAMGIGTGGEFWQLNPLERKSLASAWLPIVGPMLDQWGVSAYTPWITAGLITYATLGPRLQKEKVRRASLTDTMETAKSGDSLSSADQPGAENPEKLIDLSEALNAA